jgi:hypothetical protein
MRVRLLRRNVTNLAKHRLVGFAAAPLGTSRIVVSHEGGKLLAHRGADELIHGDALPNGQLSQLSVEGIGEADTERAHSIDLLARAWRRRAEMPHS